MKKRTRNAVSYKVKMWFFRLTKEDIYNAIKLTADNIALLIMVILMFSVILILPAFFH